MTTMADGDAGGDAGGGDGGDAGGGDGGMEGGFLDESTAKDVLNYLMVDKPSDHCYFTLLRFIQKSFRIFYVSFVFYFAPFGMLIYQYYLNYKERMDSLEKMKKAK